MKKNIFSHQSIVLLISFLIVCILFMNYMLPLIDPSEARYANICANMLRTGNYLEPQFVYDGEMQIFQGKPPLYFQLGAISCRIFGINEFAVRFPALLSGIGILLILFYTVKTVKNEKLASLSTLLCAFTPVFLGYMGLCMTDLLLTFAICASVCFYILFSADEKLFRKKIFSILFFASMGIGMTIKGPVALVMAGLPIFLFTLINHRWKDLKDHAWIPGILVFLLITVPWYWMMQNKNPDFLEYFFVNENFKRFLFKNYGDRYGAGRETFKGMAFIYAILCNLPFLLLCFMPFFKKHKSKLTFTAFRKYLQEPLSSIAFLLLFSNILFWCLTSRVLITYLLPTIPASAILISDLLDRTGLIQSDEAEQKFRRLFLSLCIVYAAAGVLFVRFMPAMKNNAGHFFTYLTTLPQYKEYSFYFSKNTPYSAEFYMRGRVKNHPKEQREEAWENSKDCILMVTKHDLLRIQSKNKIDREIISEYGPWVVFAPANKIKKAYK